MNHNVRKRFKPEHYCNAYYCLRARHFAIVIGDFSCCTKDLNSVFTHLQMAPWPGMMSHLPSLRQKSVCSSQIL